ncbi:putative methyltransferase-domain-containing protein [Mucor mucedo]|uniref:putative methyltransferase-domain-containing protein n=1 Tax=Mucor mucedo TaxID=29922 RepID=UPI0022208720|nr:putative methyltransferase-domain-containing protein [Mucor mucedo]KAI7871981.1 putative methyltransferase-domain-containing protein [Mucor mucedo]
MTSLEINTDIAEYGDFIQREQEVVAHIGAVNFEGLNEPVLLSQDLSGGCGGKIWECAEIIVNYFVWKNGQGEGSLFKDKTIIEIGAGTGLVGLAVAKICPDLKQLIITDQIAMMNLMQENTKLNNLGHLVKPKILNWGEEIDQEFLEADVILASDCIYMEEAFIPLIETFFALTTNKNAIIYLMYRKRRNADKRFFQMAKKKFEFTDIMDDPNRDVYTRRGFRLFAVKRKATK